jgi:D-methionine transport system substrate-binding protein
MRKRYERVIRVFKKNIGMAKFAIIISSLMLVTLFAGCGGNEKKESAQPNAKKEVTIKIGAAPTPHADILKVVKPKLQAEGINLEIIVLDSEALLNPALKDKQIDANFFQHLPYLNSVAKEKGFDFTSVAKVHVEPIGFYSQKIKSISELKEGAKIAISDNPSNEHRGLVLLQKNGLIKLKTGIKEYAATPRDISENPKNLKFIEVESAQLTRALPDVDGAVINTNRILESKLDPKSALFREDADSPYANIVVVRKGDETRPEIKKLVQHLLSPEVKNFIQEKYGVAVVPAF